MVGMYYGTPIVYVDPDLACGIDPDLEKLAAQESLDHQLNSVLDSDGIARFAKDLVDKTQDLASTVSKAIDRKTAEPSTESLQGDTTDAQTESYEPAKAHSVDDDPIDLNDPKVKRLKDLLDKGLIEQDEFDLLMRR